MPNSKIEHPSAFDVLDMFIAGLGYKTGFETGIRSAERKRDGPNINRLTMAEFLGLSQTARGAVVYTNLDCHHGILSSPDEHSFISSIFLAVTRKLQRQSRIVPGPSPLKTGLREFSMQWKRVT